MQNDPDDGIRALNLWRLQHFEKARESVLATRNAPEREKLLASLDQQIAALRAELI